MKPQPTTRCLNCGLLLTGPYGHYESANFTSALPTKPESEDAGFPGERIVWARCDWCARTASLVWAEKGKP